MKQGKLAKRIKAKTDENLGVAKPATEKKRYEARKRIEDAAQAQAAAANDSG